MKNIIKKTVYSYIFLIAGIFTFFVLGYGKGMFSLDTYMAFFNGQALKASLIYFIVFVAILSITLFLFCLIVFQTIKYKERKKYGIISCISSFILFGVVFVAGCNALSGSFHYVSELRSMIDYILAGNAMDYVGRIFALGLLLLMILGYLILFLCSYILSLKGLIKEEEELLTEEKVREIIREELAHFTLVSKSEDLKVSKEETLNDSAIEEMVEEVYIEEEEAKEVVASKPIKEEPIKEEIKKEVVEPVVLKEVKVNHEKHARPTFASKFIEADKDIHEIYNEIKNLAMSYGVKSRISSSGDAFRLHRNTFIKLTIAGKKVKLYLALNPNEYIGSTIPFEDAGSIKTYEDTPFVFKVKSGLSRRRATELIVDMFAKSGLEQLEEVKDIDYAAINIKNFIEEQNL